MTSLIIYSLIAIGFLALPLYLYKHPLWLILTACGGEALCIALIYASTFLSCGEGKNCAGSWNWIIPALIGFMNAGILWPVLAGYAKQRKIDLGNGETQSSTGSD